MQQVADELAIRNLLARVAQLADWGTVEECEACYAEDAVWSMPASPVVGLPASELRGRDAIVAGIRDRRAAGIQGPGARNRHLLTSVFVDFDTDDQATVHSAFLFVDETATQPVLKSSGRYVDVVRRVGTEWKLAERQIILVG
jgi:3-phenylpropionate/cinnamic acid dioxygenase small subunit